MKSYVGCDSLKIKKTAENRRWDKRMKIRNRSVRGLCLFLLAVGLIGTGISGCGSREHVKIKAQRLPGRTTEGAVESVTEDAVAHETVNGETQGAENKMEQTSTDAATPGGSPFAEHGALHVSGSNLVDKNGNGYQLFGMSTHGLSWFPEYVNADSFATLRGWNTNCVRLAMYTAEYNGYCTGGDKEALKNTVKQGVEYAANQGMYVIIDWHVLNDRNPMAYKEEAKAFFTEMSALYKDRDNIIYEICNEPNGVDWGTVKAYAQEVIPVIRANDSDAVILVGTPEWCQRVNEAAADPLPYDNIMYTLHFYAASHTDWLRQRAEEAISRGLPIFISEFGMCDASGNGANDFNQAASWMELIGRHNLSYCCWSLANKAESSCIINSWCKKTSGWSSEDLSEAGKWIVTQFQSE